MSSQNNSILSFFKDFFRFLISRKFLFNLVIAIGIFIFIIIFTTVFLRIFTNHGQKFSTPDFSGLTTEEALDLADDKNIRIEIIDSVFDAPGARGTIVDQTPPPDFLIKENRTIFLTLKALIPKRIEMPDLRNISLIQAKSEIETYGLLIGELQYKPSTYENLVIEQLVGKEKILPGTIIDAGTEINLVIGKSQSGTKTAVPDVIGLTKNEASLIAAENSLNIGSLIYDKTVVSVQDTIKAKIWKQSPPKNRELPLGSEIDLWFTLDKSLIND
jgi:beta-lactam-binding protein with PASTA domain